MRYEEQLSVEIDVFPSFRQEFSSPHSGINRGDDEVTKVSCCCVEEGCFLRNAHHLPRYAPLANERHPSEWIRRKESFIHCPVEQVTEDAEIAVHRRFGNLFESVPFCAVLAHDRFPDAADLYVREKRQKHFQTVEMVRSRGTLGEKSRCEFTERHLRPRRLHAEPTTLEFILEVVVNLFGKPSIACAGGLHVANAIDPNIGRPLVSSFEESH